MELERGVQVVTYAFLLGKETLGKFLKSVEALPAVSRMKFREQLKKYLATFLKLDEVFASWLAENLHHLNDTSVELLGAPDNSTLMAVRCSTVCLVTSAPEMRYFKLLVSGLKYTATSRLTILEKAVCKTLTDGRPVSLK
jgi:hypothetical protein